MEICRSSVVLRSFDTIYITNAERMIDLVHGSCFISFNLYSLINYMKIWFGIQVKYYNDIYMRIQVWEIWGCSLTIVWYLKSLYVERYVWWKECSLWTHPKGLFSSFDTQKFRS